MGFIKKFFSKFNEYDEYDDEYFDYDADYEDPDWDRMATEREPLDMSDPNVSEQYVRGLLEQVKDTSDELEHLKVEYNLVTDHLMDMDEVEEIPEKERAGITEMANRILALRKEHDTYVLRESSMSDHEYKLVEAIESDIAEAVEKLEKEEDYRGKIKKDLSKIDKERHAYAYRKHELKSTTENLRGAAVISMITAAVLVVVLFLMHVLLSFEVTIGYYITIAALAVALTVIYVKYVNFSNEKTRVENTINELILLENKVKIRYVNNKNLLDYLYMKYDVPDAWTLRDLYTRFQKEKENRIHFENNEVAYREELSQLVRSLRKYKIKDPEIWVHQVEALTDPKEMVETRHGYIERRQKLRKQMEYNQSLADEAEASIKKIIEERPESREKIIELLSIYEQGEKA